MAVAVDLNPFALEFDPLLQMQLEELGRFLLKIRDTHDLAPPKRKRLAEHICEWTRTVLSRSFGRIGKLESDELRKSFELAASVINGLAASTDLSAEERGTISVYADHVLSRVQHLPCFD